MSFWGLDLRLLLFFAADISFAGVNHLVGPTKRCFAEALANTMAQKPGTFVADAEHAMDLCRAHSFLARHHHVRSSEPFVQWDMAALVQGTDSHGKRFSARIALVQSLASRAFLLGLDFARPRATFQEGSFVYLAAMWAYWAIGPKASFEPVAGRGLVVEHRL